MAEPKPPIKRIFAKPAWLTQQSAASTSKDHTPPPTANASSSTRKSPISSGDDDASNLFRRAKDTHIKILADQEERERRKAKKRKEKEQSRLQQERDEAERQRLEREELEQQFARETTEGEAPRDTKRRRISEEPVITIIDDDDLDDEFEFVGERTVEPTTSQQSEPEVQTVPDEDDEDDIPFEDPILVARARAQKLAQDLQQVTSEQKNPALNIFVTGKIPGTEPLLVKRKYLQSVNQVKMAWCKLNSVPPNDVFLMYKGRKVYDVQTLESLGVKFTINHNGDAEVVHDDDEDLGSLGEEWEESSGGVHFVATTKDIEAETSARNTQPIKEEEVPEPEERKFKVVLRSNLRDMENMRLMLKMTTAVQTVIEKYRKHFNILPESNVSIIFDGEQLDASKTVGDTEIAELEEDEVVTLDVYIR